MLDLDQAAQLQRLCRFSDDGPAHAELLRHDALGRQHVARSQLACQDALLDLPDDFEEESFVGLDTIERGLIVVEPSRR